MSNFASLIAPLSISGSRLSDGEPNASGTVWFFEPGGNTPVSVYSDAAASAIVTAPVTLTDGGLVSDADYPDGIFATQPIRLLIQDVDGETVSDNVYIPATAGNTGYDPDQDDAAFTDSNVNDILQGALTAFGGQDWTYKESGGATARTPKDKFAEEGIAVEDFGAVGDGVAIDTTAIQNAMNRAKVLSTNVLFRSPTYKIDQALTLTSATGVSLIGQGVSATTITTTHASANIFTLTSCTGFSIEGMTLTAAATNSASAIALTSCTTVSMESITVDASGGGTFLIPVVTSATSTHRLDNVRLTAKAADATARALKVTNGSGVLISGGFYSGFTGAAIELAGSTSFVSVFGTGFGNSGADIGILWTTGMTGTDFTVVGCPTLRTGLGTISTAFDLSAIATNPRFRQWGNEVNGYASTIATGTTQTPNLAAGEEITYSVTSGGAGAVTLVAPTPAPSSVMRNSTLTLKLINALGGAAAVTWSMASTIWKLAGGVAPDGTDGTTTVIKFIRDVEASRWRELCRANTTT